MADPKGFLKHKRQSVSYRPVEERVKDFNELEIPLTPDDLKNQASRCVDCGIPFCHGAGCPLGNRIPEFNELVYKGRWQLACEVLHSTNNFPEFTGRVCPALCEAACTLGINDEPVTVRHIELQIIEKGFENGWIEPVLPERKTGKKVAVIGSGPAGLTIAQQLARKGHDVVVFEKDEQAGGLLRYGIPNFKLDKGVIDRRLKQLEAEGVQFQTGVEVGKDISSRYLEKLFDAVCITMGAGEPRDLGVPGRGYDNIMFAMDYLGAQNQLLCGEIERSDLPNARNKKVVVIGGGDTGSDCVGTARRQGAKEIYQLEILPKPSADRPDETPWPFWPKIMRTSSSHEEGCERMWSTMTKSFEGYGTRVTQLKACKVEWIEHRGGWKVKEVPDSEFTISADLVLLAMGFVHVDHTGLVKDLDLELDSRGNIVTKEGQTSVPWVFSAGDSVSGASLVVNAIKDGREVAASIDEWLNSNES
ncbi:Glutamate synthase [NADPH] small chain [Anaerohalosphaera lusitana]|uniref:Glutamate synthase [NADPH] small chain n=1 Tax=Anaerohalosphaera lusitana TaxID=1936003 RepID=A0A1U9NP07_9BACT|nr:glutamate synthase subunit beta [Anaerohalosphaera lusitana]AQT69246.1 Glutamate synthase [NADPH] small chain [Anaerohalosphaera lusitana]